MAGPGPLQTLFTAARPLAPAERSALLAADQNLASAHSSAASTDTQTAVPNLEDDVELHFVTFVEWEGQLVELDGRRRGAVGRGPIRKGLLEVSLIGLCRTVPDVERVTCVGWYGHVREEMMDRTPDRPARDSRKGPSADQFAFPNQSRTPPRSSRKSSS